MVRVPIVMFWNMLLARRSVTSSKDQNLRVVRELVNRF
jgi:hypothetical protein